MLKCQFRKLSDAIQFHTGKHLMDADQLRVLEHYNR